MPSDPPTDLDPQLIAFVPDTGPGVLTTLKRDGRPQLSIVGFTFDRGAATVRVSLTDDRAKTRNLRRDPRCSLLVTTSRFRPYAVLEGTARLGPVARDPHDVGADALVDLYRTQAGEHPDWEEYRAAMVTDRRLVLSFTVEHAYGYSGG